MFKYICVCCLLLTSPAWAFENYTATNLNFGTIKQTASNMTVSMAASGAETATGGVVQTVGTAGTFSIQMSASSPVQTIGFVDFRSVPVDLAGTGCTISFGTPVAAGNSSTKCTYHSDGWNQLYCDTLPGETISGTFGGALTVSGWCAEGTYTGSFTLKSIDYEAPSTPARNPSTTVQIAVTIERMLSVAVTAPMNFGKILTPAAASRVTLMPTGSMSVASGTGGIIIAGTSSVGHVQITGVPNTAVYVNVDNPTPTLYHTNGTNTLKISKVRSQYPAGPLTPTPGTGGLGTLNASGTLIPNLGGDLDIPANAPAGHYSGTVNILVSY